MDQSTSLPTQKYENVELLRGLAALGICLYHYGHGFLEDGNIFKIITEPLYLGVDIFLIITGFTLTLSLFKQNYSVKDFWQYIIKRLVRIEIPYYASLVLVIAMAYGSKLFPQYEWKGLQLDFWSISAHFFHLNDILGLKWLHEVYWTLAVQVQYYIFMGFAFIGLSYPNKLVNYFFLILFFLSQFFSTKPYFTYFSSTFIIGIVFALYYLKRENIYFLLISLIIVLSTTFIFSTQSHFVTQLLTSIILLFPNFSNSITNYLGKISYSLYLTHLTIGWSFIGFTKDVLHFNNYTILLIVFATLISIVFANYFYLYIELPSSNLLKTKK